jgi:uncharacterized Rossmann fold enzyme
MNEVVEVRVARLEEKMNFLVDEAKEAKAARKMQYVTNEDNKAKMIEIRNSLSAVEVKLAGQAPTIEEFITIKHKVVGAGKMGKGVWAIGAFIIGVLYSTRESFIAWLAK